MSDLRAQLKHVGLLFVILMLFGFWAHSAQANPNWKSLQGQPECGGITPNGQLQPPCGREPATFVSKAVGKCSPGSFFDIGTWSCYSCPTGYNRNGKAVTSDKACDRKVSKQSVAATFLAKKSCPSGSFMDPRNGGECWSCPSGYGRTAAGVDKWNACGKVMKKAVSATFKGSACPPGSFTDPRNGGECWTCPEGFNRSANNVTSNRACVQVLEFQPAKKIEALTCKAGDHFDFVDGGTCWSCPPNFIRTVYGVKTAKACETQEMKWITPTRQMPGLFGLSPAIEDMAIDLIRDRKELDAAIADGTSEVAGANLGEIKKTAWLILENEPWKSDVLPAVIAAKILAAARKPAGQRTAIEKKILSDIGKQIQWNRQFIASQTRQAFNVWMKTRTVDQASRSKNNMTMFIGAVATPPDFNKIVASTMQGGSMAAMVGSGVGTIFLAKSFKFLAPYANRGAKVATALFKIATPVGKVAVTGSRLVSAAAGPALTAVSTIVTLAMELDKYIKIEATEGKIRQAEGIASKPADIPLLLQEKSGEEQFLFHWMTLTSAETPASADFRKKLAAAQDSEKRTETAQMPTITGGKPLSSSVIDASSTSNAAIASVQQAVQPKGGFRFEFTAIPGLCLTNGGGNVPGMALGDCKTPDSPWVVPDKRTGELNVAGDYCVSILESRPSANASVMLKKCTDAKFKTWALEKLGQIRFVGPGPRLCMNVNDAKPANGSLVTLGACRLKQTPSQIWRIWSQS
ncbi:ricin-type beta-trefoil lectin domain protein [Thalassospira mesophila]|uniref:Ricin B lectin domain-containing protein n=1 Tax=Thalassospira mesophila TaxID=1293891 RepID=A0A1Y2KXK7_9PROT|nr:ricin-type beta-trefoil lectin domain protein [Thalassospira mesophila]OSQ36714.1 hypothetical protein TMES_16655 [Thalassospira mesophila]